MDYLTPAEAERITQGELIIREEEGVESEGKGVELEKEEVGAAAEEEEEVEPEKDRPEDKMETEEEEGMKAVEEVKEEGKVLSVHEVLYDVVLYGHVGAANGSINYILVMHGVSISPLAQTVGGTNSLNFSNYWAVTVNILKV